MVDKKKRPSPNKGKKGPSSTGQVIDVRADQTGWRQKLQQSRIKFDDDQKDIYIEALEQHGLKGRAAETAGVCRQTVGDHLENDEGFKLRYGAALEKYRDTIAEEVKRRGQAGWDEPIFHKGVRALEPVLNPDGTTMLEDGQPIYRYASIRKFSDRLLELEAKRVDPAYRDKQTIDLNQTGGGVLVAPADMTPQEWIEQQKIENAKKLAPAGIEKKV